MDSANIVVLGGGYAGLLAALRLARRVRGAQVTLIDASDQFVERIRLHQVSAGQRLARRSFAAFLDGTGVRFVLARVTAIDPVAQTVALTGAQPLHYDRLIYALGSAVDTGRVPGVAEHCYTLDATSAAALRAALPEVAARGGRLIIVGGGFTGLEAASEFAEAFPSLRVTLLSAATIGAGLSPRARRYLVAALARLGAAIEENVTIERVGAVQVSAAGSERPFDLCLWAGGFRAHPLARAAGLAVNDRGQIRVDDCLRSVSHPALYAVGDAAAPEGIPHDMSCQAAMPMGAHAADNLAAALVGNKERVFYFGFTLRCISLGRRDGLIQRLAPDGSPRGLVITGRFAAWIKECICRYTWTMLRLTRRWAGAYHWPRHARPLLAPAAERGRLTA